MNPNGGRTEQSNSHATYSRDTYSLPPPLLSLPLSFLSLSFSSFLRQTSGFASSLLHGGPLERPPYKKLLFHHSSVAVSNLNRATDSEEKEIAEVIVKKPYHYWQKLWHLNLNTLK